MTLLVFLEVDKYGWYSLSQTEYEKRRISSINLIREWFKQNKFTPITYATASILQTTLYENIKDIIIVIKFVFITF